MANYLIDTFKNTTKSVAFSRHAQTLLYESFRHAQGDQPNQVNFIQCYARILYETGIPLKSTDRLNLHERITKRRLPRGHAVIEDQERIRAQFEFWWLNMFDILESVYAETPSRLPNLMTLRERAARVRATEDMPSFSDDEMERLGAEFEQHRSSQASTSFRDVLRRSFLPNLVRVELNFQGLPGPGAKYSERPRTDGGDVHESKLLTYCKRAAHHGLPPSDPVDIIYLGIRDHLEWLRDNDPSNETYLAYRKLVRAYNDNHPSATVTSLHIDSSSTEGVHYMA